MIRNRQGRVGEARESRPQGGAAPQAFSNSNSKSPQAAVAKTPAKPAMTQTLEYVTPAEAERFLGRNFARNRPRKHGWIGRLARILEAGEFRPIHQGIAVDEEGELLDGQNRLTAIAVSGVGAWLWVCRGVRREDVIAVDRGVTRSLADQVRIVTSMDTGPLHVAVAKRMLAGTKDRINVTDYEIAEALRMYWEAVAYACEHSGRLGVSASVRGVIARAYYHADPVSLDRFMAVLFGADPEGKHESAALRLRDWLISREYSSRSMRGVASRKTVSAVEAFLEGRPLAKLYEATTDAWPLPANPVGRPRSRS